MLKKQTNNPPVFNCSYLFYYKNVQTRNQTFMTPCMKKRRCSTFQRALSPPGCTGPDLVIWLIVIWLRCLTLEFCFHKMILKICWIYTEQNFCIRNDQVILLYPLVIFKSYLLALCYYQVLYTYVHYSTNYPVITDPHPGRSLSFVQFSPKMTWNKKREKTSNDELFVRFIV